MLHVIIGLGPSGFSCVQFLKERGIPTAVMDTRLQPPYLQQLEAAYSDIPLTLGGFDIDLLAQASTIVLSPGIPSSEPLIQQQIKRGVPVIGDIELFALHAKAPIIAITGTNAKSTVTTLVGEMAKADGRRVAVGGNLGVPALHLLDDQIETYVLELSSFQLETTYSLKAAVATILNVTPDHMDRYPDLQAYQRAKQRIYQGCQYAVCNRDDALTMCESTIPKTQFTLNQPHPQEFGLCWKEKEAYLAYGDECLLSVRELPVRGKHYYANALASLAIGHAMGFSMSAMLTVLRQFKGLPHRCQWVREHEGVAWFNDSKGTNVGATEAAIQGLGPEMIGKLVLIAGGVGKQANFKPLVESIVSYARHVVLIGEAAPEIAKAIDQRVSLSFATSMEEAVKQAALAAKPGDGVLLSPACASFDMFKHYAHRGEVFTEIVEKL